MGRREDRAEAMRLLTPSTDIYEDAARFVLKVSSIPDAGIGCFATTDIAAGAQISPGHVEKFRWMPEGAIPDEYLKYCVLLPSGLFMSPENFLRMGIFWYVNHAREPNLVFEANRLRSGRKIAAGEELTLYYSDLLTHPKNRLWVRPEHVLSCVAD